MKTNAMINLRNIIVIILLATLSASNVSISSADSVPALPNTFSGTVKFVNSSGQFDAPAGTLIEALIDNVTKGANVTVGSRYNIDVYGTNDDDGKDIIFKANNLTAEQKSIFSASYPSPQTLNLIVNLTEQADVPSSLSIVINNGNEYTNSTAVILSLSAANAEQMSFSNDSVSWSSWEPYTTTKSWSLISEDGLKTVYFKAKNFAGEALPVNDTIILDTTPPTVQITSPANGTIVGTSNINVTGTATDSSRIKGGSIEQQSELVGGGGGLGIINSTSIAFEYNIALQEGKNSIKITYIDIANNSGSASVNVTLDTTPPGSVTNLVNTSYAGTYINWTWTDPSDMDFSKAMVYVDGMLQTNVSKGVQFYSATGFSPGTQHTIATQTVDTIGNINQTWFNHTARTEPAPSSLSIVINNGDNYTNLTSVALSLSAVDAEQMSFSNDSISWSPWENYTTTKLWKLISGDGSKTVYFKAKNGIIEVAPVNDTITLDTIPPEVNISDPVQNKTLKYFENIVKGTFSDNNIQSATLTVKNETTLWSREYSLNLTPDSNGYKFTERVEFAGDQNNTIELFALDKAGNTNVASVTVLVKNNTYVNETNVTKGNATIIDAKNESDTEIEFIPNVTTNVTFTITATTNETMIENVTNSSSKFGEVALGKIVEVNVTGLNATNKSEVQSVTIKLFYTKEDLDAKGLDENKLFVYWYNTSSGDWTKLLKGNPEWVLDNGQVKIIDSNPGYTWVKVEHLSTFALVGSSYSAPTSTPTPPAPPSGGGGGSGGSSGGGGGGGGTSGENYTNIEVKEKYSLYIYKNKVTSYAFTNRSNPILFINITGNTNAGEITTMVEVLKGTSTLVNSSAPGVVYKNVNIWVGTSGFASPRNIKESTITFMVENSWLDKNNLARNDIRLVKWDGSNWKKLETSEKMRNSNYTYFEAKTSSFSPFAIIGSKGGVVPTLTPGITTIVTNTPATTQPSSEEAPPINFAIIIGMIFLIAVAMVVYLKRKDLFKK